VALAAPPQVQREDAGAEDPLDAKTLALVFIAGNNDQAERAAPTLGSAPARVVVAFAALALVLLGQGPRRPTPCSTS
jgi:hypothetical protein